MEKEKRKGSPKKRRLLIFTLVSFVLMYSCCSFSYSYYIYPGHNLSEFGRFEREEEVVAFLHETFELEVTTSEEILGFMEAYPGNCRHSRQGDFGSGENTGYSIDCYIPARESFACIFRYHITFFMNVDDKLEHFGAYGSHVCI